MIIKFTFKLFLFPIFLIINTLPSANEENILLYLTSLDCGHSTASINDDIQKYLSIEFLPQLINILENDDIQNIWVEKCLKHIGVDIDNLEGDKIKLYVETTRLDIITRLLYAIADLSADTSGFNQLYRYVDNKLKNIKSIDDIRIVICGLYALSGDTTLSGIHRLNQINADLKSDKYNLDNLEIKHVAHESFRSPEHIRNHLSRITNNRIQFIQDKMEKNNPTEIE